MNDEQPPEHPRATEGVQRGCGYRIEGGVYLETGTSPFGQPLECFFFDPPRPYEPDHKLGVEIIERRGVAHVVDWVGAEAYPFACDVLEEGRAHGFSRRTSRQGLDYSRLSDKSRLLLVHPRAIVEYRGGVAEALDPDHSDGCKHRRCGMWRGNDDPHHMGDRAANCSALWYQLAPADDEPIEDGETLALGNARRTVGETEYPVWRTEKSPDPENVTFSPGLIASLPITGVSVIKAADSTHEETARDILDRVGRSFLVNIADA